MQMIKGGHLMWIKIELINLKFTVIKNSRLGVVRNCKDRQDTRNFS